MQQSGTSHVYLVEPMRQELLDCQMTRTARIWIISLLWRGHIAVLALLAGVAALPACHSRDAGEQIQVTRGALATPTFGQIKSAVPQTPQTSVAVVYSAAQVAGSLNVVVVGWSDSTSSVTAVTDSKGNVYQLAIGPTRRTGILSQSIYYAKNIVAATAGSNTVTVGFSPAAAFPDVRIVEYRNIDKVNPLDKAVAGTGSSTSSASGSTTTTFATELVVAANTVETATTGAGSGFTSRLITATDGDIVEDRVLTSTTSVNGVAPVSPSGQWVMQTVTFRALDNTNPGTTSGLGATVVSSSRST